jgi:hypothetical protein
MMKSVSISICKVILAVLLCAVTLLPCTGCSTSQMGETSAEGHRRHKRNLRIYNQELMADIDKALLLDRPSKLTDKRIP